jgi:hypothetical protein
VVCAEAERVEMIVHGVKVVHVAEDMRAREGNGGRHSFGVGVG